MGIAIQMTNIGSKDAAGPAASFEPMLGFQFAIPMEQYTINRDFGSEKVHRVPMERRTHSVTMERSVTA